jgi:hypothetical protein
MAGSILAAAIAATAAQCQKLQQKPRYAHCGVFIAAGL